MKTSCVMPATKSLEVDLLGLIQCEEEDAKTNAEELKDHENRNKSVNLNLDAEDGRNKKNKDNVDQWAGVLTEMFSTIPMEKKHEKLKELIE